MMEVPVPDLLQVSHPGYRLIMSRPNLSDDDIMCIVDYAKCMTQRFEFYGNVVVSAPAIFELMHESFKTLLENDDPEVVLPVRQFTTRLLEEYEHMTQNMIQAFPVNPVVKNVYTDLSEMLYEAYDVLSGGEQHD